MKRLVWARRDDTALAGGLDGLIFGVLVFVFGTLAVTNAWQVVDAKFAMQAAAREAARAYVEATSAEDAADQAAAAANEAVTGYDRVQARFDLALVDGAFTRCARVVFEARYRVPLLAVPVIGPLGHGFTVTARHAEVVDPYRSGVPGEAACANA